jgi:hypothetical protein
MKDGLRFVDCDMHIMEPPDLFERYLDPTFKDRVILPIDKDGRPRRGTIVIDGLPTTQDAELQSPLGRRLLRSGPESSQVDGGREHAGRPRRRRRDPPLGEPGSKPGRRLHLAAGSRGQAARQPGPLSPIKTKGIPSGLAEIRDAWRRCSTTPRS